MVRRVDSWKVTSMVVDGIFTPGEDIAFGDKYQDTIPPGLETSIRYDSRIALILVFPISGKLHLYQCWNY